MRTLFDTTLFISLLLPHSSLTHLFSSWSKALRRKEQINTRPTG
jgi:hypothetical protein